MTTKTQHQPHCRASRGFVCCCVDESTITTSEFLPSNPQPTDAKLLPCPFCGGSDIRFTEHKRAGKGEHLGENVWSMCCYQCGAKVPNMYKEHGRNLMVKAWNTRAPDPLLAEAMNSLAEMVRLWDKYYQHLPVDKFPSIEDEEFCQAQNARSVLAKWRKE